MTKAKVSEMYYLLAGLKTPAFIWKAEYNVFPEVEQLGAVTTGKYVASIVLVPKYSYMGTFSDAGGDDLKGKTVTFTFDPATNSWACTSTVTQKFLGGACTGA